MMPGESTRRDRIIGVLALLTVLILASAVVASVVDAEHNGRQALERLQTAQVDQLARSLASRVQSSLSAATGITKIPWTLVPGEGSDAAQLKALQDLNPKARAGYVLVDREARITNATLRTRPIGEKDDRPGLDSVLARRGPPALLSVATGVTTPLLTIAAAFPLTAADGTIRGAFLAELDVAPDSDFNKEISQLQRGRTDEFDFLDDTGFIVASTNPTALGRVASPQLRDPRAGFHHVGGHVIDSAPGPSPGWRVVFTQATSEFEGQLTRPLRSALLLLIVVGLLGGGLAFFSLLGRLRAAREEQRRLTEINAAREEFISIVSHELRTPATGQLGFLQTALDHWGGLSDDERRRIVTQAFSNARRLHALTRDVLDTASIEAGELPYAFEVLDLVAAVRSMVDTFPGNDHHPIQVASEEPSLLVRADPERIQQVLTNVLDNAMKSSPTGAPIDVTLSRTGNDDVRVEVSDRGMGMTDEELERAFEKFSRGRNAAMGTGLGLYIARKIMDAHGGRIWVAHRPGGGTTVTFAMPLATASAPNDAGQPAPA